jgi:O-antigen/teichoic acid export membrane protein
MTGASDPSLRQFITVGGASALSLALNLLTGVIVARLLGPAGFGQWALIVAGASLLHNVLVSWTQAPVMRFGSEEWAAHGTLSRTMAARLPLLGVSAALAVLLLFDPGGWLRRAFQVDSANWGLVGLYAVGLWLAGETQTIMRASDRVVPQARLMPLARALTVLAAASCFWQEDASLRTIGAVLVGVPIAIWGAAWVWALHRAGLRPQTPHLPESWRHLVYAWPLVPSFAVGFVSEWGDHVLMRAMTTAVDVGMFALAYQAFTALLIANGVFTTVLLPRLIVGQLRTRELTMRYLRTVVPTVFTLWMVVCVWAVAVTPPLLVWLGGPEYGASAPIVRLLCIAVPTSVIMHLYGILLDVQQRLTRLLLFSAVVALTNVALSVVLIPTFGAAGAAIATASAYLTGHLMHVRDQHQWLGVPTRPVLLLWCAGVVAGLVQALALESLQARCTWAAVTTVGLTLVSRWAGSVDAGLVMRIFPGRLNAVGAIIAATFGARRVSVAC